MTKNSPTKFSSKSNPSAKNTLAHAVSEYRRIESLRASQQDSRKHPNEQVDRLADSLKEFGFCLPILVDQDGEIVAGHGRIDAARRLGMKEVPVLIAADWSIPRIRAFRVVDNRLAELGVRDIEMLAVQLAELVDADVPVELRGREVSEIQPMGTDEHPMCGDHADHGEARACRARSKR